MCLFFSFSNAVSGCQAQDLILSSLYTIEIGSRMADGGECESSKVPGFILHNLKCLSGLNCFYKHITFLKILSVRDALLIQKGTFFTWLMTC